LAGVGAAEAGTSNNRPCRRRWPARGCGRCWATGFPAAVFWHTGNI